MWTRWAIIKAGLEPLAGFEPATREVVAPRSGPLNYRGTELVELTGFEPVTECLIRAPVATC